MHLYWGPAEKWLLRARFTPENPTASAYCDDEDLFMGSNDFHWSHSIAWVPSLLSISPGPPAPARSNATVDPTASETLHIAECLVTQFEGTYELAGLANGLPHWSGDDGTDTGIHLYQGPPEQGLWLLRTRFDPESKSCSGYCSCTEIPTGSNIWHFMHRGSCKFTPQSAVACDF